MKRSRLLYTSATVALVVASAIGGMLTSPAAHAAGNPYQVSASALKNAHPQFQEMGARGAEASQAHFRDSNCVQRLDSIANFCGSYTVPGIGPDGQPNTAWGYQMVGNAPSQVGPGTTTFQAPIIPVAIQLLNPDGSVAYTYDPMQYVQPLLNSPVFSTTKYSSGPKPTQFTDAVQRAEFFDQENPNWHTMLDPVVRPEETMKLPAGSYQFALNPDGTCCQFVLVDIGEFENLLFPPTYPVDNTTIMGQAELSGAITTKDISTFLFPNTFLYFNGDPTQCCVLGFHTFDFEPGATQTANPRAYVMNYSSWISPGLFGSSFTDVTATSHEMSETFNDPFVTAFGNLDTTPWWLAPNGNCQNDLETGDVIEGLSNAADPITMNGFTYHPQNEALMQWFESGAAGTANGTPNAIDGAFSYPNESVLPTANVSQTAGCTEPFQP